MIKSIRYIVLLITVSFWGCDNENAFDCVKTVGDFSTYEIALPSFTEIEIIGDISLQIENSIEQSVSLTTGQNLYPKIDLKVVDGKLTVADNNDCSWVRKYGNTTLHIKSNNITSIKNSGSRNVNSIGTYNIANNLYLISKNASGDYYLDVTGRELRISSNKVSNFYINGSIEKLFVGFYSGQGRFEGTDLIANNVNIFHRGSNDMMVNPQLLLTGSIEAFGNLIVTNVPDSVNIIQNGPGQVIYGN
ncbi:MAG: DUF2807 domain-containing protein [Cyclobacteriaceae bacterium]|nr:DUF2807 domain-containing protein [Cyclobacteriaceae bacterium]